MSESPIYLVQTPMDVLKRELDTVRTTVQRETLIRNDWWAKANQMDQRLSRHRETIEALELAVETLEEWDYGHRGSRTPMGAK